MRSKATVLLSRKAVSNMTVDQKVCGILKNFIFIIKKYDTTNDYFLHSCHPRQYTSQSDVAFAKES